MDGLLLLIVAMLVFALMIFIISISAKKLMLVGIAFAALLIISALGIWG
ncbi:MAG: hypothetical protein MUC90_05390 [Thermoplasmata archaeon]|nr:hypothetical protein [Thermoplasmata archaeon]